jgi:asparagine synthase (glutamine-hydrolysing)
MCGIYGIASFLNPINQQSLIRQRDRLAHRGPDDKGFWISESRNVGLAHRRLSIIDLSSAGHQPMTSSDGRSCITYNGEVYNFQELRIELEKLGFRFAGGSDTEVVLSAYQAWGDACVKRFNGMFALAIYDEGDENTSPSLFLARDRVGKKPLYYYHDFGEFQFSSELKALDISTDIDSTALNHYLALGYIPGDLCLAMGVKKLPPAHMARLDLRDFTLKCWRYWQVPVNSADPHADEEELADRTEALLTDAVRLRMISDVPLGVLLSGGLDSSLIVAAAARSSVKRVKTFTIALPGSRLDESGYARCVADHFNTEHHVLDVSNPLMAIVDELAPFVDEPLADSSLLPSFMVSCLTRQHVTSALGGDGGDELFGGYTVYSESLVDQARLGWIPAGLLEAFARLAARLPAGVRGRNRLSSLIGGPLQQMIWGTPYFDVALRQRILSKEYLATLGMNLSKPECFLFSLFEKGIDPIDSMTRTHFGSILPDDFLVKVDRASMAHSLEMRTPFLDYRLVELAFGSIPNNWKVSGGETRRIQRILARRMLPPDLDTNRKQGFSIPLDDWLRADCCNKVRECIPYLPQCIERNEIENLIVGEMKGRANGARLFALIMLGIAMKNNEWTS